MGNKQSMGVFDYHPPVKPEVEPTHIEDSVDENGKKCSIVFYKERGFKKGRKFAVKIDTSGDDTNSVGDIKKFLGSSAKSVKVKGAGCDAAGFTFRGYSQPDLKGKKRVFNTKKQKNFPRPAPIRSYEMSAGAERAIADAETDPGNNAKVNKAVNRTAEAMVDSGGWDN